MNANWVNDPLLQKIPARKLVTLQAMIGQADKKSRQELISYVMQMAKNPSHLPISFTPEEKDTLLTVIQKYASPQETAILSKAINMMQKRG